VVSQAGQERFRSVTHSYYRDADALLLLYDVTSYSSFDNISSWLNQIKELTDNQVLIMLIGNKIDKSQRVVSRETGERLARDYQINFLETSAKTGQNVELAFMTTAQDLLDKKLKKDKIHFSINHSLNDTTNNSCC
jgi:small GTP-binding protein